MTIEVCVSVTEARDLTATDENGTSDPFYIVGLCDENKNNEFKDASACVRSKPIFCTLNPVWGKLQKADFKTTSQDHKVRIELWDKDHALTNDFEGYVLVDITFQGVDSKKYWLDLLPRTADDKFVSGAIHVTVSWNFNFGIHSSVAFNKEQRAARIFLSSTFIDMHEERETIMRKVMVELDQFCYERQVSLTYIDMRWGITDDMSKEYKTIQSCLQEVNNSRPYFVGIIGQRYGWHQEKDGADEILTKTFELAASHQEYLREEERRGEERRGREEKRREEKRRREEKKREGKRREEKRREEKRREEKKRVENWYLIIIRFEWINNFRDRSVTELEILHGFLLHPSLPTGHAFFYLRDPEYLNTLDEDSRAKFKDSTPYAIEQLEVLKERIRHKAARWDCTCVEDYKTPADLGNILLEDLKKAIDRDFPIVTSTLSTAHKQRLEHENYAHQRCHAYVPRPQYFSLLDQSVEQSGTQTSGRYVLVTGESGSGKSSLMAAWWKSRTHSETEVINSSTSKALLADTPTFIHFIGAGSISNSFSSLLMRLYDEINEAKKPNEAKIEKPKDDEMVKSLPKFLKAASLRGKMVIVFDALNQLPTKYHDLHWLPSSLPPNICILISSTPESVMLDAIRARCGGAQMGTSASGTGEGRWMHISVQPLENEERKLIVQTRLSKYGKKMTTEDIERIVSHPCSKLPLFITTVLLELCTIGFYDKFKSQLANFLSCKAMPDLFQRVLERWEESFGRELAEKILPLLANSRSGVTEKTMQIATKAPTMQLSPMLTAMKQMLVVNQSMYNFGHIYLRAAVLRKYSPELHYAASCRLAEVLSTEHFNEIVASKLPWLLEKIMLNPLCEDSPKYQQQLADILLDLRKFMVFYEHDSLKYWDKLVELNKNKWKMGPLYVESAKKALKNAANTPKTSLPSTAAPAPLIPTPVPVSVPPTIIPSNTTPTPSTPPTSSPAPTQANVGIPSSLSSTSTAAGASRIRAQSHAPPARPPTSTSASPAPSVTSSTVKVLPSFSPSNTSPTSFTTAKPSGSSTLRKTSSIAVVTPPPDTVSPSTLRKTSSISHVTPNRSVSPTPPSVSVNKITTANGTNISSVGSLTAKFQAQQANTKNLAPTPTLSASTNPGRLRTSSTVYNKAPNDFRKSLPPSALVIPSSSSPATLSPSSTVNSPKAFPAEMNKTPGITLGVNRQQPPRGSSPTPPKTPTTPTSTTPSPSTLPSGQPTQTVPALHTPSHPTPSHPTPSHPTPNHSTTNHPTPNHSTPSHPAPSHPTPSHPTPNHPSPSHPTPNHPTPNHPTPNHPTPNHPSSTPRPNVVPPPPPPPIEVQPGTFFSLASFLFAIGLIHEAQEVGELSLAEYRKYQDKNGIARALYLLGVILRDQGYLGNARTYLIQALELRIELFGECHPEVATSLDKLGWLLKSAGELLESLKYFTRALAIQKKLFGNRHEEVASTLNGLGSILCELGNLGQAREYFDEALSVGSELFGTHHPNVAQTLHNIGVLCLRQEKWDEALDYCERAKKIRENVLGHHHVDVAASLSILGTVLLQKEKLVEAEDCFKKAQKIQSELLGADNPEVAVTLANLGVLEKRRGNFKEARNYNEGALNIRTKLFGPQHPLVESSLNNLGGCCYSQGDFEKARECFDKVLDMQVARLGGHANPRVQQTLGILESIARRQGKPDDAKTYTAKIIPKA